MDRFEQELARRDRRVILALWGVALGRKTARPERWELGRARLLGDPSLLRFSEAALRRPLPGLLERRVLLLHRAAEDVQVEQTPKIIALRNRLLRADATLAPHVEGRKMSIGEAFRRVRSNPDQKTRRAHWEAIQDANRTLEADLLELARLRNESAREAGHRSYVDLRLSQEGIRRIDLEGWSRAVLRAGKAQRSRLREAFEARTGASEFYPWDQLFAGRLLRPDADGFFPNTKVIPWALEGLRGWGLPPKQFPIKIVWHTNPTGGVTYAPTIPTDVRFMIHPRGRGGWALQCLTLHELGHAVHACSVRAPTHFLRGNELMPGYPGFLEGVGQMFYAIGTSEEFLRSRPGLGRDLAATLQQGRARDEMLWACTMAVSVAQEFDLYTSPNAGLSDRFARRFRAAWDYDTSSPPSFANTIWIQYGLYMKSYFLAEIFAAQIREAALGEVGGEFWPNRRLGPWLVRNWLARGATFDWVPHVREVSGKQFGPDPLLRHLHSLGS